jgi:glycosyltransferase involved in cell wall biosynthesis
LPNLSRINYICKITGSWSEAFKKKYSECDRIQFLDFVENIDSCYESAILLNPVITGGGLRTKILQAFVNKVPVISTSFGAEGCFHEEDQHIALFNNADDFVKCLQSIDFLVLAQRGYEYYQREFSKEKLLEKRLSLYK